MFCAWCCRGKQAVLLRVLRILSQLVGGSCSCKTDDSTVPAEGDRFRLLLVQHAASKIDAMR